MRFLCLHGRGTNSDIFERQLAPLITLLSDEHSFDFLDAQFESPAAPGIAHVFAPPYLTWHDRHEAPYIKRVHEYLKSVIEADGPYDGIIGFSQGAALAASLLLEYEFKSQSTKKVSLANHELRGSPFKLAVFFNSVMPFSSSREIGSHVGDEARKQRRDYAAFRRGEHELEASSPGSTASVHESNDDQIEEQHDWDQVLGFEPSIFSTRIQLPTLHVIGVKDPFANHSRKLVKLCRLNRAQTMLVDCGHDLPRGAIVLRELAEVFELVVSMASMCSR